MALEVLYGPSDIALDGAPVASASGFAWIQGIGLLMTAEPATTIGFYAVQMDGTVEGPRSDYNGSGFSPVLDLRSARGLAVKGGGSLYNFNWLVGKRDAVPLLTAAGVNSIDVIVADRYLHFSSGSPMQALASADGITFTAEYTFAAPLGYTFVNASRCASSTVLCLAYSNGSLGQLRFYDTSSKTQIGDTLHISEGPDGCWYVPKWNVFIELKSKQLKILANLVYPDSLSNPASSSAVVAGLTSQISVQLLGDQNEPCQGELINWSVASGSGSLVSPQSVTDATGTAINTYICPVGSSGSVVIDAQLNY